MSAKWFNIGEFSRITGLPVKTLHFYHEKGILIPTRVDESSGYRYYDESKMEVARIITALREMEFSIEEIGTILKEAEDERDLLSRLEAQKERIAQRLNRQRQIIQSLNQLIAQEKEARLLIESASFKVEEKKLEPLLIAGFPMKGKYSDCGQGFKHLGRAVGRYITGKPFCLYYDEEYRENDANFETCFPVRKEIAADGLSIRTLPGGRCLSLLHKGPYGQLGRSYEKIFRSVRERGAKVIAPCREIYLKGPGMIFRGNPRNYLTEIQFPLEA